MKNEKDDLLSVIKEKIGALAQKINAPERYFPLYVNTGDATCIEVADNEGFSLVFCERGTEFKRKTTCNMDEFLYWIFEMVTFSMACEFELKHRIEKIDSRRMIFAQQEHLLAVLNEKWAEKQRKSRQNTLSKFSFDDLSGIRASFYRELRQKNVSEEEIDKLAYKKYPKNVTNPINTATGVLSFRDNVILSPNISLSQTQLLYPNAKISDMKTGYFWLNFKEIKNDSLIWAVSACFFGEKLYDISLYFRRKNEKPLTWDDFSEKLLEQEKKKYKNWLKENIGAQTEFPWGKIEAYYDPKSENTGIWISYVR